MKRPYSLLLVLVAVTWLAACGNDSTGPKGGASATLLVRADVSGTAIALVVAEVTAADIATPLVFNLPVSDGVASGPITVPAGSDRTFTFTAFDAGGVMTHSGATTVDVQAESNAAIAITLTPLSGDVPIDVTLGTVTIAVVPSADTLGVGDTVTFTARVEDADGQPVTVQVSWATLNPAVATVMSTSDSTGLVTAQGVGETSIVATYGGTGAAGSIVVSAEPQLELVATVANAVYLTAPPADLDRVFIVSQDGVIHIVKDGTLLATPFLDISGSVSFNGEAGLLSMVFHPDYAVNGFFYVSYSVSPTLDSRIERYLVSADPDVADAGSAVAILTVPQPEGNHNGGLIEFGPDGMMYFGLGDGGGSGDPNGHGQDSTTLLGSMLRIDVDGGSPYAIPPDNPFAGHATAREEIWAYGFRNPWRFSFDRVTGDLYIADVGESAREEVDFQPAAGTGGENYGWNTMEGTLCFSPSTGCDQTGLVLPIFEYSHSEGCSISGGYVYRGSAVPALVGHYFYGDFCNGWIRSFRVENGAVMDERDYTPEFGIPGNITSFGEDAGGELYVVTRDSGIFRISAAP